MRKLAVLISAGVMVLGLSACDPTKETVTGAVNTAMAYSGVECEVNSDITFGQQAGVWIYHHSECTDHRGWPWTVSCTAMASGQPRTWNCSMHEWHPGTGQVFFTMTH